MLKADLSRFIQTGVGDFTELALRVFRWQYEQIAPFRRLCDQQGCEPGSIDSWEEIPLVPTLAFKNLRLESEPAQEVFTSSGTRSSQRSRHYHANLDLYRQVIEASFPSYCLPPGQSQVPMLSLIPPRESAPHSSLSFMIDHVSKTWSEGETTWALRAKGLRFADCRSWLSKVQRQGRPALILSTSLALVEFLDKTEKFNLRFRMPPGSLLFETGGYKGLHRTIERSTLLERIEFCLGLAPPAVVREYGMTELTSQCYAGSSTGLGAETWVTPAWMRCRVLSPSSLEAVGPREEGLVSFLDLANMGSAVHVLTEDWGRACEGGFNLLGRAADAELRGCSLTAEEMIDAGVHHE